MDLDAILVRSPVNGTAARVTTQGDCASDLAISREDLRELIQRTEQRRRALEGVLGIKTAKARRNLMQRFNKYGRRSGKHPQPRALLEYVRLGEEVRRLQDRMAELRRMTRIYQERRAQG